MSSDYDTFSSGWTHISRSKILKLKFEILNSHTTSSLSFWLVRLKPALHISNGVFSAKEIRINWLTANTLRKRLKASTGLSH